MSAFQAIQVCTFESPSLFFYRDNFNQYANRAKANIEYELKEHVRSKTSGTDYHPQANALVGYFNKKWEKWIRAKVTSITDHGEYQIFLIDYGHFLRNRDVSLFVELPQQLTVDSPVIHCGSLGLQPGAKVKDRKTLEMILEPVMFWDSKAIQLVQEFNYNRESYKFHFLPSGKVRGVNVGDVIVESNKTSFSIRDKLISEGLAIVDEEKAVIRTEPVNSTRANPIRVAAGVNLGNYTNQRSSPHEGFSCLNFAEESRRSPVTLARFHNRMSNYKAPPKTTSPSHFSPNAKPAPQQMIPKPSKPNVSLTRKTTPNNNVPKPFRSPPRQESRESVADRPSDIMVYGGNVRPPVKSIILAPFSISIKKNIRNMTTMQSHCWAQIYQNRSMVIIEKAKIESKTESTYLPVILNALQVKHSREPPEAMGPIAIIVLKSSTGVKAIGKEASLLAPELSIVQASGMSEDKRIELINGCDLLIATPKALARLIAGPPKNLFDKARIKHLIFDGFDLMQRFDTEIHAILRACTMGKWKEKNNPQIIVTSSAWLKDIETKFMPLMERSTMVICMEDFIEAAAYSKCTFVMQTSTTVEEKIQKLIDSFKVESYKSSRTLIVTGDDKSSKSLSDRLKAVNLSVSMADGENHNTVKNLWLQQAKGNFTILIACDSVLKKMELRNLKQLIHFAMPKSWNTFTHRFVSLLEKIYEKLEVNQKTAPITKILLEDENILEFAKLIEFMDTRDVAKVTESELNYVKQINQHHEQQKFEQNVAICPNIWQFGECKKYCNLRHTLYESDKPLSHLPAKTLVKFELVSVVNPTSYTIKILSHMSNNKWISWSKQNQEIELILKNELHEFCNSPLKCRPANVKVGEIYAMQKDDKWLRCRVVEISNKFLAIVHLLDVGSETSNVPCAVNKLSQLPAKFKIYDPLIYNLNIVNLVPFDAEEHWDVETKEAFRGMMQSMCDEFTFVCNVKMAIRDILFAESFDGINKIGAVKFKLKEEMLKANLCEVDGSVEEKLHKIAPFVEEESQHDQNLEVDEDQVLVEPEEAVSEKPLTFEQFEQVPLENWKHLSWNTFYEIHVKLFKNPESFLVLTDATDKNLLQSFTNELEKYSTFNPLESFLVGTVCAVIEGDKIRRGKIMETHDDDMIDVLLVDDGEVVKSQKSKLFQLPAELITKMRFQVVHCRMVGIRPKFNMTTWPPKQRQAIHNLIVTCNQPIKAYVLQKNTKPDQFCELGVDSYDVILIDPKTDTHLDVLAVANNLADRDEVEKPELSQEKVTENISVDEKLNAIEAQKFIDLLEGGSTLAMYNGISSDDALENDKTANAFEDNKIANALEDDKTEEHASESNKSKIEEVKREVKEAPIQVQSGVEEPLAHLEIVEPEATVSSTDANSMCNIYKQSRIEWRQNEVMIYMLISATDCLDYGLTVNDSSMQITIKFSENRCEKTLIEFYTLIDPCLTSHELRGLSIVVRLAKKVFQHDWPRLTVGKERSVFIKYSTEQISWKQEEQQVMTQSRTVVSNDAKKYVDSDEEGVEMLSFNSDLSDEFDEL